MIFALKKAKFYGTTEVITRPYLAYVGQDFNGNFIDYKTIEGKNSHGAWDVPIEFREPLYAIADYKTLYAKRQYSNGEDIGNLVILNHPKEKLQSWYRHMDEITISEGGEGKEGDLIGYCDSSGKYSVGNHLHFELKEIDDNDQVINTANGWKGSVDPKNYFVKPESMKYIYNSKADQYILIDNPKVAIGIADVAELDEFKKHGLSGEPVFGEVPAEYMVIVGIRADRMRDLFNL